MGYIMEALHVVISAKDRDAFALGGRSLKRKMAPRARECVFGEEGPRRNGPQYGPADLRQISPHRGRDVKRAVSHTAEAA
jgi:hypothetical protein